MSNFTESVVEEAALEWLEGLGYAVLHGPEIAAGEPGAERTDPGYREVVLENRLRKALERLNPGLPPEAIDDAYRRLTWAGEACGSPVIPHIHDVALTCVHLKTLGGSANRLLKQPSIQLQLEADLGVVLLIDLPRELRVTDQVPIAVKN